MATNPLKKCERCGKEIEVPKHFCGECRKIRRKETYSRHRAKPEVKEARRIYSKLYWDKPENKVKQKMYYENYKKLKVPAVRHCKRCGTEIGRLKRYCAECKELQDKERELRYRNSSSNERRKLYYAEYNKTRRKQGKTEEMVSGTPYQC
jgi:predicted nucleic acid-binding Zn ribbon protein